MVPLGRSYHSLTFKLLLDWQKSQLLNTPLYQSYTLSLEQLWKFPD